MVCPGPDLQVHPARRGHAARRLAAPATPRHSRNRRISSSCEGALSATTSAAGPVTLDGKARLGLTLIAGGAVANIYYNQPLLGLIVAEFGERAALWVPTTALVGYGLGIVGLVPLGDTLPRRRLIVLQCLAMALALLAPSPSCWQSFHLFITVYPYVYL